MLNFHSEGNVIRKFFRSEDWIYRSPCGLAGPSQPTDKLPPSLPNVTSTQIKRSLLALQLINVGGTLASHSFATKYKVHQTYPTQVRPADCKQGSNRWDFVHTSKFECSGEYMKPCHCTIVHIQERQVADVQHPLIHTCLHTNNWLRVCIMDWCLGLKPFERAADHVELLHRLELPSRGTHGQCCT